MKIFRVKEKTSALYTATLKDGDENPVALADIATITLTLYNADNVALTLIRNAQDVKNNNDVTIHATSGLLSWTLNTTDTTIADQTLDTELHIARFDFTYGSPTLTGKHEVGFRIENLKRVT